MTVSDVTPIETDPNFGRRQGRLDLDVAVHLATHEGGSLGVVKNVSSGGMFVATSRLLSVGDQVAVCLSMLDEAQIVEAEAEVRWLRRLPEGDGMPAQHPPSAHPLLGLTPEPRPPPHAGGGRCCAKIERLETPTRR